MSGSRDRPNAELEAGGRAEAVQDVLEAARTSVFVVAGRSMEPGLPLGARVRISPPDPWVEPGEIALIATSSLPVLHRVVHVFDDEGEPFVVHQGDAGGELSIVSASAVLGRAVAVLPARGQGVTSRPPAADGRTFSARRRRGRILALSWKAWRRSRLGRFGPTRPVADVVRRALARPDWRREGPAPGRPSSSVLPGIGGIGAAAFLFVSAVATRIVPVWSDVVRGAAVVVSDPDSCYHLVRAREIARSFPDLLIFDDSLNWPRGASVPWPPFFDGVLASLLSIFPMKGTGAPLVVALLNPLLLGFTAVVVFAAGRRLLPGRGWLAFVAGASVVVAPASFPYSRLGNADHHAAEVLLAVLYLYSVGRGLGPRSSRPGRLQALAGGLALGTALLVQPLLAVLVPLPVLAILMSPAHGSAAAWRFSSAVAGVASALVLPFAWAYGASGANFSAGQFGLFYAAVPLAAALASASVAAWLSLGRRRGARRLASAVLLATAATLGWEVWRAGTGSTEHLLRRSAWIASIGESRSLFLEGWGGLAEAIARGSLLLVLVPLAVFLLVRRSRAGDGEAGVFAVGLALFLGLAGLQARFLPHIGVLVGIGGIVALEPLVRRLRWAGFAAALLAAVAFIPTARAWGGVEEAQRELEKASPVLDAAARATSPRPDGSMATGRRGVLAEWSFGHFLRLYAGRPVVADNFGQYGGSLETVRRFFLETDADAAAALLRRSACGHVLVGEVASTLTGLALEREELDRYLAGARTDGSGSATVELRPAIVPTVLYRLATRNGGGVFEPGGRYVPPATGFRLIDESTARDRIPGGPEVAHVKLYEAVKGAHLAVSGWPGDVAVEIVFWIVAPGGGSFPLLYRPVADARGELSLSLPYPTEGGTARSRIERVEIPLEGRRLVLSPISEAQVRDGARVVAHVLTE